MPQEGAEVQVKIAGAHATEPESVLFGILLEYVLIEEGIRT